MHTHTHTRSRRDLNDLGLSSRLPFAPHSIPVFMSKPDSSSQSLLLFLIFSFLSDLFSLPPSCLWWSDIIRIGLKPGKAHKDLFVSLPCFPIPQGQGIVPLSDGWSRVLCRGKFSSCFKMRRIPIAKQWNTNTLTRDRRTDAQADLGVIGNKTPKWNSHPEF